MKILITGTAGFVGFYLAQKLAALQYEIVGIDNINDYYDIGLKHDRLKQTGINSEDISYNIAVTSTQYPNYRFVKLSLEDHDSLKALFEREKFDVVCHLAAQAGVRYSLDNPSAYINSNVVGFVNLLECCRHFKIKHLVYASSSSVYGMNKKVPFSEEDNVDHPVSLYAATKKTNELFAHTYSHLYGIPTTGLRFFTVYGPWGRPDMAPYLFTNSILREEPIKVFNQGAMSRDFTYIDDVVEGLTRVLMQPFSMDTATLNAASAPYRIFNIGNSSPVKLLDFINCIEVASGKKAIRQMLPMQPGDVINTYADTSKLEAVINYKPSTPLQTGIDKFVEWFKAYYISSSVILPK